MSIKVWIRILLITGSFTMFIANIGNLLGMCASICFLIANLGALIVNKKQHVKEINVKKTTDEFSLEPLDQYRINVAHTSNPNKEQILGRFVSYNCSEEVLVEICETLTQEQVRDCIYKLKKIN